MELKKFHRIIVIISKPPLPLSSVAVFCSFWEVNRPRASHSLLSPSDRLVFIDVTSNKNIYIFMFVQIIRQFPFMCEYLLAFICVHSSRLARLLQNSAIHRSKAVCYSVSGPTILHPPFFGDMLKFALSCTVLLSNISSI